MAVPLQDILHILLAEPTLLAHLSLDTIVDFFDLIHRLKFEIALEQSPSIATPPTSLPQGVRYFLQHALLLSRSDVKRLWTCLKHLAWQTLTAPAPPSAKTISYFTREGLVYELCE
jgi:hypothetical protein